MQRNGEGLTKTYNRFHDRYENHPDTARLRQLHEGMDRAVLCEYVWDDIPVSCEFLSDLESEEKSNSKRFCRYRWPDEVHDEVLGRLIELNAERAREKRENEEAQRFESKPRPELPLNRKPEIQMDSHRILVSPPLFADDDE